LNRIGRRIIRCMLLLIKALALIWNLFGASVMPLAGHSGMPAIRKAWANLSIYSALRHGPQSLIREMRWVGSN
jgi:hypothetical protein